MSFTPEQTNILSQCFLFRGASPSPAVWAILEQCPVRQYHRGEVIYSRQQFQRAVGILLSGGADILKGHGVVLNTLGPGDSFGVAGLFTQNKHYVSTVSANRPTCVLLLTGQHLQELFAADGTIALRYIGFLSDRICFLNRKLDSFTASSAEARIALYLLEQAQGNRVQISGGYAGLSRQLGIGRASLYRCLDSLEATGILARQDREILLLDLDRLADIAG